MRLRLEVLLDVWEEDQLAAVLALAVRRQLVVDVVDVDFVLGIVYTHRVVVVLV